MSRPKLNIRQKHFAKQVAKHGNASEAARQAGYSNAKVEGSRLLSNDNVKQYIDDMVARADAAKGLTPDAIVAALIDIAQNQNAKDADRLRALELIGKNKRMFADVQINETPEDTKSIESLEGLVPEETLKALKRVS